MPLVAVLDGERLEAFRLTAEEWSALRSSYKGRELVMTCGSAGIPKTSARGIQFFAHKPKSDCTLHTGAPEGPEHLQAKALLAEAARRAGWTATVEHVGPSREWVADVLIERGETRTALEVQWSPQPMEVFEARTARYAAAGIGCRWFLGRSNHNRPVPGAYKISGVLNHLSMAVPGTLYDRAQYKPFAEGADVLMSGVIRQYAEFHVQSWNIGFKKLYCWASDCRRRYSRWYIISADVISRCGIEAVIDGQLERMYPWQPFAEKRIEQALQAHVQRLTTSEDWPMPCRYELGNTDPVGRGYIMAMCPFCGKPQEDSFAFGGRSRWERDPLSVKLDAEARRDFRVRSEELRVQHLCEDVGNGQCEPPGAPDGEWTFPLAPCGPAALD